MQTELMKFDPATGEERPYPSHSAQWRNWHGVAAWLFDPWTGKQRNAYDVGSDVHGLLIVPAGTLGGDTGGGASKQNKHAHCVLAQPHGFEALIDHDDEPTGTLLDQLKAAEAENIEADATVTRDETARMLADTLQAVRTERDRLRRIAYDAATSLESISKLAGLAQHMDTMSDIRAYARSRADFARAALENTDAR